MQKAENSGLEGKERAPNLEVTYGIKSDVVRVKNTIARLPWYKEQGYNVASISSRLPVGLSENPTEEEVGAAVSAEYSEVEYKKFKEFIEEKWGEFSKNFEELSSLASLELRDNYTIILTKYGMGGSYNTEKGEAIINLTAWEKERIMGVIFHEIVHMTVEHLIKKYQIKHWYKERLVGLMMEKYFPGAEKAPKIREDVAVVDEAFDKFFPDFEAIVAAIK